MMRLAYAGAFLLALAGAPVVAAEAPVSHEIEARLDPGSRHLEVTDILTVRGRAALEFRVAPWLEVETLLLDGRPADASGAAALWRMPLPDAGEHRLELRLAGTVPSLPPDGGRGAIPSAVSGAEGSYLSGYAGWIPVTEDDWTAYRLAIEVPAPHRAVATGRLENETQGEATNRAIFAADYPAELPALFAGPYIVQERRAQGIRMRTYFHRDLDRLSAGYLDDAGRYLTRYSGEIGPYPFPDFHIVSSPLPVGLGFPNLIYIGRMVLPLPFMRGRSLAHEVLHNWWGNGVAPDYAAGNWSEGLTTYMADYALAVEEGADKALEMRMGWLRNYAALPPERDMPVTAFTSKRHDAGQVVGYDKVAFIYHMLRAEIGAEAFTRGLQQFWQQNRFRVAGWAELRQSFEEAAGRDLGWFFAQWLGRTGAPRIDLGETRVREEENKFVLELTLRQDSPAYRLRVPVAVDTDNGRQRRWVPLDGRGTAATLEFGAKPTAIHIDPDHDLFRRLLPREAPPILRDVTLAADTATFIVTKAEPAAQAARQLAERLLDTPPRFESGPPPEQASAPWLIIGLAPEIESFMGGYGLAGVPDSLAGRGTARVWTVRRESGPTALVISADSTEALQALLRPLPHYGGKSYLVFEGRRAVDTGIWPVLQSPLSRRLAS